MTDFMRTMLNPPFTVSQGREWQALGSGSKKEGNYTAQVSTDNAPKDTCSTEVSSNWGQHGIFKKTDFKVVSVKDTDKTANLETTLGRDGVLHVKNSDGENSSVVDVPLGDVSKADPKFFEPGAFAAPGVGNVQVAVAGSESGFRFNESDKQAWVVKNGAIFQDS